MKPAELMINDWVMFQDPDTQETEMHQIEQDDFTGSDGFFHMFIGVPILEEMFNFNGFSEHKDLDEVATYLNEAEDYLLELQAYKEGDHWRFRIQRGPEAVVSIKARYVHELQHAMRLMGLYDMADNFKVQKGGDR